MKQQTKQNLALFGLQLAVWLVMMLAPACIVYLLNPSGGTHWMFLWQSIPLVAPMFLIYMVSFYVLVPYLYFRGHRLWYILASIAFIALINIRFMMTDVSMLNDVARTGFYTLISSVLVIHTVVVFAAFGVRNYVHSHRLQLELQEERRKSTEAELTWLKNQLNPHFLFNSLNNISSLTQIDPDQAQEAIAQLSDLLRYALYESNKPQVPLTAEVEFMHNYISMMRLRCSDLTTVEEDLVPANIQVAPLLFISFIENAFKHGSSNTNPSHIAIHLQATDSRITFSCKNTNFPKSDTDRSGSGVGLENTRRRLDLLYPGRYTWQQEVASNEFRIVITLDLLKPLQTPQTSQTSQTLQTPQTP